MSMACPPDPKERRRPATHQELSARQDELTYLQIISSSASPSTSSLYALRDPLKHETYNCFKMAKLSSSTPSLAWLPSNHSSARSLSLRKHQLLGKVSCPNHFNSKAT